MANISKRGRLGQAQVLAAILFLFLIPTTVILAENATNSSNTSIPEPLNLSFEGLVINTSDIVNQSPTLLSEPPVSNESSETNISNSSVNEELPLNQTLNETLPETTNQTSNETSNNETQNETVEIPPSPPETLLPYLTVSINGPDMIVRGKDPTFFVEITNTGDGTAQNIIGLWIPNLGAFECDDLETGEACTRELILPTTIATPLGIKEIGVSVSYD